jgi:hypothetical protein
MSFVRLASRICLLLIASISARTTNTSSGQPILIDTDIMSDVDDVGALTVANVLHNCGLADLRGVAINTHSKYGALAANVSQLYFKRVQHDAHQLSVNLHLFQQRRHSGRSNKTIDKRDILRYLFIHVCPSQSCSSID